MSEDQIETHPLPPFLPKNAKLLMLGSFPPPQHRWKMDFYYPNYQNDMWRIFGICFYQDKNYFLDLSNKNFYLDKIIEFLNDHGIAIYDTAYRVKRLTGNASDKFLEIVENTNVERLLNQIPDCQSIVTTGDKATETLLKTFYIDIPKIKIGEYAEAVLNDRQIKLYRMPSSSRAYPLAVEKKAEQYMRMFKEIGLIKE